MFLLVGLPGALALSAVITTAVIMSHG